MNKVRLPKDSRRYAQAAFRAKERWHRNRSRMSLTRKLQALDRMREAARTLPRLVGAKK